MPVRRLLLLLLVPLLVLGACGEDDADGPTAGPGPSSTTETSETVDPPSPTAPPEVERLRVRPTDRVRLSAGHPNGITLADDGTIWVSTRRTVHAVDPEAGRVVTELAGLGPHSFAVSEGVLWASDFDKNEVSAYDVGSGVRIATVRVRRPEGVLVAHGAVWVAMHHDGSLARIDPATQKVTETVELHAADCCGPQALAADDRYVYVGTSDRTARGVYRIDPASAEVVDHVAATGVVLPCGPLTVVGDVVWAGGCQSISAAGRFDFATTEMTQAVFTGYVGGAVATDHATWFTNVEVDGSGRVVSSRLIGLDPETGKEIATAPLEAGSDVSLRHGDALWVAAPGELVAIPLEQLQLD